MSNTLLHTFDSVFKALENHPYFVAMKNVKEDSSWHRESSVYVHTQMVIDQFKKAIEFKTYTNHSEFMEDLCVFFGLLFHDVGKPVARDIPDNKKTRDDGTVYYRFTGHEKISTRMWEDFAVRNMPMLAEMGLTPWEIFYKISWMIENHLPYGLKDPKKIQALKDTIGSTFVNEESFYAAIRSDAYGRISDDHDVKKADTNKWIAEMKAIPFSELPEITPEDKKVFILVGASGSGKSTFSKLYQEKNPDVEYYSWDALRLKYYFDNTEDLAHPGDSINIYNDAYKYCTDNESAFKAYRQKAFIELLKGGNDIIVDNVNASKKTRAFFVSEAKNKGYRVIAVTFPIDKETLIERANSRSDKRIGVGPVLSHYDAISIPSAGGEVDHVEVMFIPNR